MEIETAAPAPEMDAVSEMEAAYDRLTAEGIDAEEAPEAEAPAEETPEEPAEVEPAPEVVPPTDIPAALREHWGAIPEAARAAIEASHREMSQKLGTQGRMVAALNPIRDALSNATREHPALRDMSPAQVVDEIRVFAGISQAFNADPVKAVMGLVKQHGLEAALGAALSGQPVAQDAGHVAELKREIAGLKTQLQRVADPASLRQNFDAWSAEASTVSFVDNFATEHEHWGAVEPHMPQIIPLARDALGESASAQDVLSRAYEMAVTLFVPKAEAAPPRTQAPAPADPERIAAAVKAKSVNVSSQSTGRKRDLSPREEMSAVYDRLVSR